MAVGLVIFGSNARKFWNRAGLLQPEDMSDLPSPGSESPCQGQGQSARRPLYTEVLRQCPEGDKEASDHGSVSLPKVLGTFDCFFFPLGFFGTVCPWNAGHHDAASAVMSEHRRIRTMAENTLLLI